jgi:hypothetical protein
VVFRNRNEPIKISQQTNICYKGVTYPFLFDLGVIEIKKEGVGGSAKQR